MVGPVGSCSLLAMLSSTGGGDYIRPVRTCLTALASSSDAVCLVRLGHSPGPEGTNGILLLGVRLKPSEEVGALWLCKLAQQFYTHFDQEG